MEAAAAVSKPGPKGAFLKRSALLENVVLEPWATRSSLEAAVAAGGSWPKRRHFEEERFIEKCCFGTLGDQELFWDCPSCLELSGEGYGSLGCSKAF